MSNYTRIENLIKQLEDSYSDKLEVNSDLSRSLVSFQANKKVPGYRWYKFKEGYSLSLVDYVLRKLDLTEKSELIDPFVGSGTSVFAASQKGIDSTGIELLPLGTEIIEVRKILFSNKKNRIRNDIKRWIKEKPWRKFNGPTNINYINITEGAYPAENEIKISQYVKAINNLEDSNLKRVLRFAVLCILEEISYTRKDGQYLRWDHRAKKSRTKFDKGEIKDFDDAIIIKLNEIYQDTDNGFTLFDDTEEHSLKGKINLLSGSSLELLPKLRKNRFDILMTSPPYCNRYDYTRTYALELALLGASEKSIKELRQTMLSCTVENKEKDNLKDLFVDKLTRLVDKSFAEHKTLQEIINYLNIKKINGELNNSGIVRMVKNYFYELAFIIFESARILKPDAYFVMVNDNVRYAGIDIPVDLILSDFAKDAGFETQVIWVLPRGKGNSSQQMGRHGRKELRKCVYVWRRL